MLDVFHWFHKPDNRKVREFPIGERVAVVHPFFRGMKEGSIVGRVALDEYIVEFLPGLRTTVPSNELRKN